MNLLLRCCLVPLLAFPGALALAPAAFGQQARPAADGSRPLGLYDAEYHIGLVAENATENVAAANTLRLNDALAAMHARGSFDFARGPRGPVLLPIVFAAKPFYFKGELQTGVKVGSGALVGGGGVGYPLGDGDFGPRGLGGATTRLVRIDPTAGGAVLRLRGAGFSLKNIELYGRRLAGSVHSGASARATYGIALEGRNFPATGKHTVDNVAIVDCDQAIAFLPGYNDDAGQPVAAETHADESLWGRLTVFNCGRAVVSANEQATWHHFQHLKVIGGVDPTDVIFDIERGGVWKVDMLTVGVADTTVLRVRDFSQNMSRFDINGIYRDHFPRADHAINGASNTSPIVISCANHGFRTGMNVKVSGVQGNAAANGTWTISVAAKSTDTFSLDGSTGSGAYTAGGSATQAERITLFEFAGDNPQPWKRWSVRMSGHFSELPVPDKGYGAASEPTFAGGFRYATADLIRLNGLTLDPSGRYGTSIQLDINNLPSWIAARHWPHGAYRLTADERDLIPAPYPGLSVWVLDSKDPRQKSPTGAGHLEIWNGSAWTRSSVGE